MRDKYSTECLEDGIDPAEFHRIVTEPVGLLKDGLLELVAQIYTEIFTDEEVDELVSIYSSPTFQRLLELTPEIHKRTMTFVVDRMDEIQAQVEEKVEALLETKNPTTKPRRSPWGMDSLD
ncbi:MAG: hypothetical protein A2649_03260 [Candidatus Yanofskybacteria bacterium RIFCSPHIGHO2_01_FULL_41_26]|uniref:DUF2059 domain-containing protein n=1 Tax=Candidatus Yanofskybacteria bacterium RIFCSPHIGHO2_01_FULL_41_26 TaxID=1802661 RepID=A0A1F8EBV9_9BACT|nr:MAG: hypothetical protein A2649_03260 [Candidatus Yanofskybacteria bacterium RIFCSPHIGHO2_01_FULL_41_26]